MPTYNYICQSCGKEIDMFMNISQMESSDVPCPESDCDSIMIRKIGAPAVNMNGHEAVRKHKNKYGGCSSDVPTQTSGNGAKVYGKQRKPE